MKKEYVKPSLTVLGDARELTAKNASIIKTDVREGTIGGSISDVIGSS